ncbi:MAG: flagellar biosynthetic protein FliR [Planctomycetota bacterium]|jgi:flagellar biosynthetic protein FliR|nr:flagellar biosynthetic protein FliR [Planctomycetota bacterium]
MRDFYGIIHAFPLYIIVLIRTTALLGVLPIFKRTSVPMRVKASLAALLAMVIMPTLPPEITMDFVYPDTTLGWTCLVMKEVSVGIILGFVAAMIAAIPIAAGEFASRDMGLSMAAAFNPETRSPVTPISQIFITLFSLLILVTDTHLWFIELLAQTYHIVPISGLDVDPSLADKMVKLMSWIYILGVKLAAPIMAILFITTVSIGIMALAAPQVNILMISFPIRLAIGLIITSLTIYSTGSQILKFIDKMKTQMMETLYLMA